MQEKMILALSLVAVCMQMVVSLDCERGCSKVYAPVCGMDGNTYGNNCSRVCAGVDYQSDGACPIDVVKREVSPCDVCQLDYNPECGMNGQTYINSCHRECENVALARTGACDENNGLSLSLKKRETTECICPLILDEVCGSDGTTYGNQCQLECKEGVTKVHDGACGSSVKKRETTACACPHVLLEVCGSDGITYGNQCLLECEEGVTKVHDGACGSSDGLNLMR